MERLPKKTSGRIAAADGREAELVERAAGGDGHAGAQLIERYLWVAALSARKYASGENVYDDLLSVAYLGLVKGVNAIDPARVTKLSYFFTRCTENEILMYLRRNKKRAWEISLEQAVARDRNGRRMVLGECLAAEGGDVGQVLEREERSRALYEAIQTLDERQRKILEMRFGLGGHNAHTQCEIVRLFDTTQSYVSKLEKKLLKRIRSKMEE